MKTAYTFTRENRVLVDVDIASFFSLALLYSRSNASGHDVSKIKHISHTHVLNRMVSDVFNNLKDDHGNVYRIPHTVLTYHIILGPFSNARRRSDRLFPVLWRGKKKRKIK